MPNSVDFLRALVKRAGTNPLARGVDSRGRGYSVYLHPATPIEDGKVVALCIGDNLRHMPHSITVELGTDDVRRLLELLALLVALDSADAGFDL